MSTSSENKIIDLLRKGESYNGFNYDHVLAAVFSSEEMEAIALLTRHSNKLDDIEAAGNAWRALLAREEIALAKRLLQMSEGKQ